jgi:FKBP-type peptidyl-prolyl cis-trans isomerase FkpA
MMNAFRRAMPRLIFWISLPLLATPLPAGAQAVREAKSAVASPKPAEPNTGVIPLPLMPIVPASQRACAAKTPSGLGYTMLRAGTGAQPTGADTVLVNYVGYLAATGAVFDQNMQTPMPVGGVIPGFSEGLQLLSKTGIVRLCIPAAMAYGAQASETIPANADLVFQVELIDFKTAAEIAEMRKAQAAQPPGQGEANPQP